MSCHTDIRAPGTPSAQTMMIALSPPERPPLFDALDPVVGDAAKESIY